ncbi:MAG: tRNA (adenosine(37)-N6)-threonylcarbamoyltransferase complex ATPase subunit type 1 TsaE [Pyrinomonadaceae bacterium]|nr:tRNA (adenosine(37)-N6)-threonylcarbamoyltransferase complex ATPase subunit type 1 TsaE [Phycisphaerales bacterium]
MNLQVTTHSEDQTFLLGRALGAVLRPGDFLSLDGELGAGKTRLVRGMVGGAGLPTAAVNSPTYVIAQEYTLGSISAGEKTNGGGASSLRIVHVDAYRLRGVDELESVGWDALISSQESPLHRPIVLIEWADRIERALPKGDTRGSIRISHDGDGGPDDSTRVFDITLPASWKARPEWVEFEKVTSVMNEPNAVPETDRGVAQPAKRGSTICPITGKLVPPDSPTYPFTDERARMADLSRWLSGGYVVSREITAEDLDEVGPGESA